MEFLLGVSSFLFVAVVAVDVIEKRRNAQRGDRKA